jgi:hypothetical protein
VQDDIIKGNSDAKRIGLIAGNGKLPIIWADCARKEKIEVIAIAFKGETEKLLENFVDKIHWLRLGQLNNLINILKEEDIRQAVMIGQIRPVPFLFKTLLIKDMEMRKILNEVRDKRGNSLLAAFAGRLEEEGINLLDSRTFIGDYLPQKGNLTKVDVDERTKKDIEFGFKLAKQIADLDIGQTIVIKDLAVLAVEAIEGTNQAILRGARLGGKEIVVIKVSSPRHDMRFDIPVVGPKTIHYLNKVRAKALAIEAQRTLIVDKEKTLKEAQKKKIAIVAL